MARLFLFNCPNCNHQIELLATQAGQELTCSACEQGFEAPKLGILNQLPTVGDQRNEHSAHTDLKRLLFSGGLVLAVLMGAAGYALNSYASKLIVNVDLEGFQSDWSAEVEAMTPVELLQQWDSMVFERGLGEWQEQVFARYKTQGTYLQYLAYGLLCLAAIGVMMIISSFLLKGT